jgi:hypothetical protein
VGLLYNGSILVPSIIPRSSMRLLVEPSDVSDATLAFLPIGSVLRGILSLFIAKSSNYISLREETFLKLIYDN